jgi:hypothetical protein
MRRLDRKGEYGGDLFYRASDGLSWGGIPVLSIFYQFWDGELRVVELILDSSQERPLRDALTRNLGEPSDEFIGIVQWGQRSDDTFAMLLKGTKPPDKPMKPKLVIADGRFFRERIDFH